MPDVAQEAMEALLALHSPDKIEVWNPEAPINTFWDVSSQVLFSISQKLTQVRVYNIIYNIIFICVLRYELYFNIIFLLAHIFYLNSFARIFVSIVALAVILSSFFYDCGFFVCVYFSSCVSLELVGIRNTCHTVSKYILAILPINDLFLKIVCVSVFSRYYQL